MSRKNRNYGKDQKLETNNVPAEQDTPKKEDPKKEDKDMNLKEAKKNIYQTIGEALTKHGDKKAAYAKEHPIASKVKAGIGIGLAGAVTFGAVVAGYVKNKKKDDSSEDYYDEDDFDELEDARFDESETEELEETETEEPGNDTKTEVE